MKPNRNFDTPGAALKDSPATDPTTEDANRSFYRVAHAGPFIFATNNPADGFKFIRSGHPSKVFTRMMDARAHAYKNLQADPLNWRKSLQH